MKTPLLFLSILFCLSSPAQELTKEEMVHAITRGAGLLPGQVAEAWPMELEFRQRIEQRKDEMLATATVVQRPTLLTEEDFARARANMEHFDWAKAYHDRNLALAEYVLAQPSGWINSMLPELTPTHGYGLTCPRCVGEKSQEAAGTGQFSWSYQEPEKIECRACGQTYPDPAYPETAELHMPRMGQTITYYLNEAEGANPEDRSGKLAYHWVGFPIHVSFTGVIRERKIDFMRGAAKSVALAYAFTKKPEYAAATRDILLRFAHCYRNWLYHDYWDTFADCDPMFAAWNDRALPLEWKRHLSESAYEKDTLENARMLRNYWGAGRTSPSTDSVSGLGGLALAYDLTCEAADASGAALWTQEQRQKVERDLLLEWIMGAEPYIGGAGKADSKDNKSPRIYRAMAEVAKMLGLPNYADVALRGYERVRDESFIFDGFSTETPSYTNMYLAELVMIPEILHGFEWSGTVPGRSGTVDYFGTDQKLGLMFRALLKALMPDGALLPLGDTNLNQKPSPIFMQVGVRRYPDVFAGLLAPLYKDRASEYAWFSLTPEQLKMEKPLVLPETLMPAWGTAILRHGERGEKTAVTLAFNPEGGHRHKDSLGLFYWQDGKRPLGDLGYVGDMPLNDWIKSTFSHNLVVVDNAEQQFEGRDPQFHFMASSPLVSVVEASSAAYSVEEYRRRIALVKLPNGHSFLVDIFRVRGGKKHAFRVYSEHAASDASGARLEFEGVAVPEEPPLPQVGASLAREDIYGLRDVRSAVPEGSPWKATWRDDTGGYRLWMLSPAHRVEASNGPGQCSLQEPGRRVRYVDAVREGEELASTFVAIHEPSSPDGSFVIESAEILDTASGIVLRIQAGTQTFLILNDCESSVEVGGVSFSGSFAFIETQRGAYCAVAARDLTISGTQVVTGPHQLQAAVSSVDQYSLNLEKPPLKWPQLQAEAYVRARTGEGWIGLPVETAGGDLIALRDYPAPNIEEIELSSVLYSPGGG